MEVFCGIDWAEDHHDIALVNRDGQLLARRRISDDAAGLAALLSLLAEHGDGGEDPIPVAIETPRGLLTACLRATASLLRDLGMLAVRADASELANSDLRPQLAALSRSYDGDRATRAYQAVDEALAAIERNASPKVVVDWLVLQL